MWCFLYGRQSLGLSMQGKGSVMKDCLWSTECHCCDPVAILIVQKIMISRRQFLQRIAHIHQKLLLGKITRILAASKMQQNNRQVKLPAWSAFAEPGPVTLPRWDALGSPDRTGLSPVEPSLPHKPIFKVRVKPGQTIISLLDLLEDTEFEHVLSRTNKNRTARRLLELEIQQARDRFEAPHTPDFWDFTDRSQLALRSELAKYEIRFVEKGRKSIEVLSPKTT